MKVAVSMAAETILRIGPEPGEAGEEIAVYPGGAPILGGRHRRYLLERCRALSPKSGGREVVLNGPTASK